MIPLEPTDNWEKIFHWPFAVVLTRMGMAVAVGIFVGLEREHSQKTGVRTFSMVALFLCSALIIPIGFPEAKSSRVLTV